MFTLFEYAIVGSLLCLGGQGAYLLYLKHQDAKEGQRERRKKQRRKQHDQRAKAGRDIGTQAGRDIHYHPPVLNNDSDRVLRSELDLVQAYLMEKTMLCQEYMGMYKEARAKVDRLQEENTALWKEVQALKAGDWSCPVLRIE
jgi:hypothetical protein